MQICESTKMCMSVGAAPDIATRFGSRKGEEARHRRTDSQNKSRLRRASPTQSASSFELWHQPHVLQKEIS